MVRIDGLELKSTRYVCQPRAPKRVGCLWPKHSNSRYIIWTNCNLVGGPGPPLWKIGKSIGMISNPICGKIKFMFQTPNHQPVMIHQSLSTIWNDSPDPKHNWSRSYQYLPKTEPTRDPSLLFWRWTLLFSQTVTDPGLPRTMEVLGGTIPGVNKSHGNNWAPTRWRSPFSSGWYAQYVYYPRYPNEESNRSWSYSQRYMSMMITNPNHSIPGGPENAPNPYMCIYIYTVNIDNNNNNTTTLSHIPMI